MLENLPILGVCGYSGSGKTTLVERMVPELVRQGLAVLVIKHDAHGLDADRPGKDSDRFFRAGADVLAQGPLEQFMRAHREDGESLERLLPWLCRQYDLVLIEGHKGSPLPKVWLLNDGEQSPPPQASNVLAVLGRDEDRYAAALALVHSRLQEQWRSVPVLGGILIGGRSSRMGTPKHLICRSGKSWLQHAIEQLGSVCSQVVILGAGNVPPELSACVRLPDVPNARGPLAGVLAAMRWAPTADWLMAACDLPGMRSEALEWLLSTRRPGVWATLPRLGQGQPVEPLLAYYNFRCLGILETQAAQGNFRLNDLAAHPKAVSPVVPEGIHSAWNNVNQPGDLHGWESSRSLSEFSDP